MARRHIENQPRSMIELDAEHDITLEDIEPRRVERRAVIDTELFLGNARAVPAKSRTVKHSLEFSRCSMSAHVGLSLHCNQDPHTIKRAYRIIDHILDKELEREQERMLATLAEVEAELQRKHQPPSSIDGVSY